MLTLDTNAAWQPAVEPITHDKPKVLGVGLGVSFGKTVAEKNPDVKSLKARPRGLPERQCRAQNTPCKTPLRR